MVPTVGPGDIWGSPSGDAAEDFDDLTDDELEERREIIEQERAERELELTTLSIRQLDPEGRGTFAAMRFKRLAMSGHCPLIAAQHNDPRFTEPRFRKEIERAIDELDIAGNMERASERMRKLRLVPDQCPPTRRSE